jgi:hypothetical protein
LAIFSLAVEFYPVDYQMFRLNKTVTALTIALGAILAYPNIGHCDSMAAMLRKKEKTLAEKNANPNQWSVSKGDSLRNVLYRWSKRQGWNLVWHVDYDITLAADARFNGSMQDAISLLLTSVNQNNVSILAKVYPANKVLLIKAGLDI